MAYIRIDQERVTETGAAILTGLCPFGAISGTRGNLKIDEHCRMCGQCLHRDPCHALTLMEGAPQPAADLSGWQGICVFAEQTDGKLHPVTLELLGKALELAQGRMPVTAVLPGVDTARAAGQLCQRGAERVYVYESAELAGFDPMRYAACLEDCMKKVRPAALLVGATGMGRSLAPRLAARLRTGLTADCTGLSMREDGALVQVRPAFGGNIMAQIVTPKTRPQICTVRYRVFNAPQADIYVPGKIVRMVLPELNMGAELLDVMVRAQEQDLTEAERIVAVGRGCREKQSLYLASRMAELLGAQLACTRPMVEEGYFHAKKQIGLSGRTVKPKLLIALGISGSVQFAAGMDQAELICAVNTDPAAPIFGIAHFGFRGNVREVLPALLSRIEKTGGTVC